eukprot:15224592-Ditylum_brightwellii.AAC.1
MQHDIPQGVKDDLTLWLKFLSSAMNDILINLIVFRKPTFWSWSKACEWGLGGYNNLGMAWRLELLDWMFGIFTVNFLEFLANIIMHWITVPFVPLMCCYLNLSDITNTVGQLYKSLFQHDTQYEHTALAK